MLVQPFGLGPQYVAISRATGNNGSIRPQWRGVVGEVGRRKEAAQPFSHHGILGRRSPQSTQVNAPGAKAAQAMGNGDTAAVSAAMWPPMLYPDAAILG